MEDSNDSDQSSPSNNEAESTERRNVKVTRNERRVINRLGAPTLKLVFNQFVWVCRVWTGFAASFILLEVISNFVKDETRWSKTLFFCFVAGLVTYFAERLRASIIRYLNSESVEKSVLVFQDALLMVFAFVIISIVFGIVHILNIY